MPEPFKLKGLGPKKPSGPPKPKASLRNPIFGAPEDENEDGSDNDTSASIFQAPKSKPYLSSKLSLNKASKADPPFSSTSSPLAPPPSSTTSSSTDAPPLQQLSLSARHTFNKHAASAQEVDPSVYEYDDVYDSLHAKPQSSLSRSSNREASDGAGDGAAAKPKYISSLLAAAEVRKRDRERARDAAVARERAAEGEEFRDKEAFVTGAYKQQQADARRAEEEEKRREQEEEERRRKNGGGMTGLYRDLLGREDERHARAMQAQEELLERRRREAEGKNTEAKNADAGKKRKEGADGDGAAAAAAAGTEGQAERDLAEQMGATLNEDGQVVDKRQLLSAGLNVSRKQKDQRAAAAEEEERRRRAQAQQQQQAGKQAGRAGGKQAMRERQTRMLEQQLEEASKRAADDDEVEREALQRAHKRRTTDKDVGSAKERYLARKREAEAAKKAGTAS